MSKKNLKSDIIFYGIILAVLTFIGSSIFVLYKKEYINNPIIQQNISAFNTLYIYDFYISATPNIDGRIYYGNKRASITIIAFMDIDSEASRYFMKEIFPKIEQDYINTGKVRIYFKHYITVQDFQDKNNRFLYAHALSCVESANKESYYRFYFDLFKINGIEELKNLLDKHKIDKNSFDACIKQHNYKNIIVDMHETENFGISGITPRFYIGLDGRDNIILEGVPKYTKFKRTIKEYEVTVGE